MDDFKPGSAEWRIRQLTRQNRELRTSLEALGPQAETIVATRVREVQEAAAKEVERITRTHAEDMTLHEAGLTDPLGRRTLRQAWEGVAKAERGDSPVAWWAQQVEAHKAHVADPAKPAPAVPRPLTVYLPQVEAQQRRGTAGVGGVDRGAGPAQKGLDGVLSADYDSPEAFIRALAKVGL